MGISRILTTKYQLFGCYSLEILSALVTPPTIREMQVKPPTPNLRVWRSFILGWTFVTFCYGVWIMDGAGAARGLAQQLKKKGENVEGKNELIGAEQNK